MPGDYEKAAKLLGITDAGDKTEFINIAKMIDGAKTRKNAKAIERATTMLVDWTKAYNDKLKDAAILANLKACGLA